jgi:hypothetical protein
MVTKINTGESSGSGNTLLYVVLAAAAAFAIYHFVIKEKPEDKTKKQ